MVASGVDEPDFSALVSADEPLTPISDELYAEQLQLQEVLASSLGPVPGSPILDAGQSSSHSSTIDCEICTESKTPSEMFDGKCRHNLFCKVCIGRHIEAKVEENICVVLCPDIDCCCVLEPVDCRRLVREPIFERWGSALCESSLLGCRRFYCPYKDCSAPFLLEDDDAVGDGEEEITQAECGICRRLFCAKCSAPWHADMACEKYQSLGTAEKAREDLMFMELAERKQWKSCPSCRFFVERTAGCLHMVCRFVRIRFVTVIQSYVWFRRLPLNSASLSSAMAVEGSGAKGMRVATPREGRSHFSLSAMTSKDLGTSLMSSWLWSSQRENTILLLCLVFCYLFPRDTLLYIYI